MAIKSNRQVVLEAELEIAKRKLKEEIEKSRAKRERRKRRQGGKG